LHGQEVGEVSSRSIGLWVIFKDTLHMYFLREYVSVCVCACGRVRERVLEFDIKSGPLTGKRRAEII